VLLAFTAYYSSPFWVFLIGYFLLINSQSVTSGNMQVLGSDLAPARARGRFIGIWRMLAALGGASSPTLFSIFATIGYAASFSFLGVCAFVVCLVIGFKVKETVRSRGQEAVEIKPEPEPVAASDGPPRTGSP
jgi:sugar phosphate permease